MITCRVLGPVSVEVDGGPAPPELLWRKHLALLVYLARSPKRGRTREHLTGMLWPDKDETAARHSLNEALRVIRRAAGDTAIETTGGQVRLSPGAARLDAEQLEPLVASESWEAAAAIVAGPFLEGFAIPDSESFEDWLAADRRHWNDLAVRALLGHSSALLRVGRAAEALATGRRAESLEPHSDLVARTIISALAIQGDQAMAAAHYEQFTGRLRELGTQPAPETRALLERVRMSRAPRSPSAKPPGDVPARRAPLVGRAAELDRLLSIWDRCRREPVAAAILLEGDAGSGKTRLLEEFVARVRLDGGAVALVRAVEADRDQEGSGWLGLARGGLLHAPGLPAAPPQAIAALAAALPDWAERFSAALRAAGSALPLGQAMTAVWDAALSGGPLLLAIDDAQWLDRLTLLCLTAALRDFGRSALCVICSAVPAPAREELDELRRRLGHDLSGATVTLKPLDAEALRTLGQWALPGYDSIALERVCRRIASDSAGLPLLAVELLSAVTAGLDVQQGAAAWPKEFHTLTSTLPGDLPDTVVAALRIGFRRLSADAQQVLATASVIGEGTRITESQLARASGLPVPSVQAALDELEWQRWLESDGQGYGFVARVARQVVARDMVTKGQAARIRERLKTGRSA
ncbi:MAG: AAA family ATPase [Gemmatimonadales bacterium]